MPAPNQKRRLSCILSDPNGCSLSRHSPTPWSWPIPYLQEDGLPTRAYWWPCKASSGLATMSSSSLGSCCPSLVSAMSLFPCALLMACISYHPCFIWIHGIWLQASCNTCCCFRHMWIFSTYMHFATRMTSGNVTLSLEKKTRMGYKLFYIY